MRNRREVSFDLPFRDIGVVLMLSVAIAIAWYSLIVLGVGLVLDASALADATLVTADANAAIYGEAGAISLLVAGFAGIITSWNAFILGGSRAIYALARADLASSSPLAWWRCLSWYCETRNRSWNAPYRVPFGKLVGTLALLLSIGLGVLYLPGSPSALVRPQEWAIVIVWAALGAALFTWSRRTD